MQIKQQSRAGRVTAAARDVTVLWDSPETPEQAAKPAPVDDKAGEANATDGQICKGYPFC